MALVLFLFVLAVCGSEHVHDHGHGHGHGHGHAHASHGKDHHAHAHAHAHAHSHEDHGDSSSERSKSEIWMFAVIATVFVGMAPIVILFFVPLGYGKSGEEDLLKTLLGFAVGGLLGDVFLHLIPHAMDPHDHSGGEHQHHHDHGAHDHSKGLIVGLFVLLGIIVFFAIEKYVRLKAASMHEAKKKKDDDHHSHSHSHVHGAVAGVEVTGWLNLAADFSHNFTDGLAIGASFLASNRLGMVTTVAVVIHEIPHEIGDFAILVKSGMSRKGAMIAQVTRHLDFALFLVFLWLFTKGNFNSDLHCYRLSFGNSVGIACSRSRQL